MYIEDGPELGGNYLGWREMMRGEYRKEGWWRTLVPAVTAVVAVRRMDGPIRGEGCTAR